VIVVLVLVFVVVLVILMALPRQRESARLVGCQRNLSQIGIALNVYAQGDGLLPAVGKLAPPERQTGAGPLAALLGDLGLIDLSRLTDPKHAPPRHPGPPPFEHVIAGFVCPSDIGSGRAGFPAPISYRACAGDAPGGRNGAFAPGKPVTLTEIEAADGLEYTAGFAERLTGTGGALDHLRDYAMTGPALDGADACPLAPRSASRGDAGCSWAECSFRSTLYNHALVPDASPSCIAGDGASAFMGASSGHVKGVHVLMLSGSVRALTPSVDLKIWKALANFHDRAASTDSGP
jgi:hypothetical protein